ncbi:MAG: FHA domain-containing protein, partial [Phormidesmis sp.]
PNCNHQNPDGALQCEACYTPLPAIVACPNCNAPIQANASFCGQCGSDLRAVTSESVTSASAAPESASENASEFDLENPPAIDLPDLVVPEPLVEPEAVSSSPAAEPDNSESLPTVGTVNEPPEAFVSEPSPEPTPASEPALESEAASAPEAAPIAEPVAPPPTPPTPTPTPPNAATQLQTLTARLRQVQTNTPIEIPRQLSVVRIGKPNDQTPPDIDVSGFPDSEVVSRVHANLRVEGDVYYLEDVGSSNGTYINGLPLPAGNRHRLRPGDRIALGKGDKVSFIFETA